MLPSHSLIPRVGANVPRPVVAALLSCSLPEIPGWEPMEASKMRDSFWLKSKSYADPELASSPWKPTGAGGQFCVHINYASLFLSLFQSEAQICPELCQFSMGSKSTFHFFLEVDGAFAGGRRSPHWQQLMVLALHLWGMDGVDRIL